MKAKTKMMEDTLDSLKSQMGHIFVAEDEDDCEEDEEENTLNNEDDTDTDEKKKKIKSGSVFLGCIELGFTQRMVLGLGFLVGGFLLLGIAPVFINAPTDFVWVYGFANVFVLCSCVFIIGPTQQVRVLAHDKAKLLAVLVYVGAMMLALVAALRVKMVVMTMFFVAFQLCSAFWYLGSHIPYLKKCVSTTTNNILPL